MQRVVIVDDEEQSLKTLAGLLQTYCPDVEIAARCCNIDEAQAAIKQTDPDIVFLDVEMPGGTGFDLLSRINPVNFHVIFTTAHDEYAIRAIRYSALDFLLKPIGRQDLVDAVNRATAKTAIGQSKVDNLIYNINYLNKDKKIALPTLNGLEFVSIGDVVRCESDNNYTVFYFQNRAKIVVSKTLKEYEELLDEHHFFRIHQSHLINLRYISRYSKEDGGTVTMSDNSTISISRRKKDEFLKRIAVL